MIPHAARRVVCGASHRGPARRKLAGQTPLNFAGMNIRSLLPGLCRGALLLIASLHLAGMPALADDAKNQAIARLAASHDPDIPIAIGRVVIKQAGLKAIRAALADPGRTNGLGADWNPAAPEWQAAEGQLTKLVDDLIAVRLDDAAWFREGLGGAAANVLNAEEADEIAAHFATEGGSEQRVVVDLLLIGETVLANYTFTDRLDYRVKGTEREIAHLQRVWWAREPFRARDFSRYPGVVRFAGENPGIRYTRMLAIQGIEVITNRIDSIAGEAVQAVGAADVEPFIEAYRLRKVDSR